MKKVILVMLVAVIVLIALVSCNNHQTIAGNNPAPTTTTDTSYAYALKAGKVLVSVKTTPSKTVLTIDKKTIVNPEKYKYYPTTTSFTVQCQPERGMLFVGDSKQEVQVSVLPITSPAPKETTNIKVGNKKGWRLLGNTDITYRYSYRVTSTDGKRLYELVQDDVESESVSPLFASAVQSFKEVTVR